MVGKKISEVDLYNNAYGKFENQVLAEVRRKTYGEDLGQSSWMTKDEFLSFMQQLQLNGSTHVLDVACGTGNPTLFMVKETGTRATGIDINPFGIKTASRSAKAQGLSEIAAFKRVDASKKLPFDDETFDAAMCIDAIIHIPNRLDFLKECRRVLKVGGRLLYTDPTVISGLISKEELATRSSTAYFLFAPREENEKLIQAAGDLELLKKWDATPEMFTVSSSWYLARKAQSSKLKKIEGPTNFEGLQKFLSTVRDLASERRLCREVFLAQKK
jgi:SAM-dependent methyltransferase